MTVSFGKPGDLRKTFSDAKFELHKHAGEKVPCPLKSNVVVTDVVIDGQFMTPDGEGKYIQAADASRALVMVFTAATERVIDIITADSPFPGEDRTDTPTGLFGFIEGIWPSAVLFLGATGGGNVALNSYAAGTELTVKAGKLCPANFGENANEAVVGRVMAPSTIVGASSIAARVDIK